MYRSSFKEAKNLWKDLKLAISLDFFLGRRDVQKEEGKLDNNFSSSEVLRHEKRDYLIPGSSYNVTKK